MNISINVGVEAPEGDLDLAGKINKWEALADRRLASGGARILHGKVVSPAPLDVGSLPVPIKPAAGATSITSVGSPSSILYKGAPLSQKDVGCFLSDMFTRVNAEQRRSGKTYGEACTEAKNQCARWRAENLDGGILHGTARGA